MAKLVSVKTLDMVNGEITKVAYGGAEYVKTEGLPKMDDLVLAKEGGYDITYGAFYKTTEDADHEEDVRFLDDVDDGRVRDADDYVLFRKVASATNPSVEERVAKAEGEIESLKSDVAALKGEAEYKRITKSEARAGDYVKFIETDAEDITIGKLYEIEAIDCDGDPVFADDIDQENYATSDDTYEVYRKVSAAEPKPERLKVGEYAKVVQEYHHQNGEIIILRDRGSERSDTFPFRSERLDGTTGDIFGHRHLVRATDEEVAEAKRAVELAKFKEGAKVRLKSGGEKYPLNGFENGKIYEVVHINFNHRLGRRIAIEGGDSREVYGFATPDQLEILSEEEAAEHKKWAKIGREVGEYKEGDIFRSPGGNLFEITRIDDRLQYPIRFTDLEGDENGYEYEAYLTLITPVEARFDR
ncbi:hypothetical protein [Bacillus subtilis]|uniref:hypothetical protein n=1 Tax=Bacillus subtilis TaxID=1423 RepID=UPI002DC03DAA|nr:hypothetical protein [Bacillus subtilis]MEC0429322.1 hypothetical protein [Bacillus subtilis]